MRHGHGSDSASRRPDQAGESGPGTGRGHGVHEPQSHRGLHSPWRFSHGQVEFKDFLWEALLDPSCDATMGGTAETLAKRHKVSREEVDAFAADSFARAVAAQKTCFLSGEIVPLVNETFACAGYNPRGIRLPRQVESFSVDSHIRPSPIEVLAKIRPAFGGVQTGGNSSAVVDGAAATLVASGEFLRSHNQQPLGRVAAGAAV